MDIQNASNLLISEHQRRLAQLLATVSSHTIHAPFLEQYPTSPSNLLDLLNPEFHDLELS